jgi:hypothetical protein
MRGSASGGARGGAKATPATPATSATPKKTWFGTAKSGAKGFATYVLPHTVGLLPLLMINQNPLKGLENLLNPANWVQDLSWLGGLLDPSKWGQDLSWLEGLLKGLVGDVETGFKDAEGFAQGAFRDAEAVGKDAIWGVEEAVKYAPYIGGFIAVLWVIQSVQSR